MLARLIWTWWHDDKTDAFANLSPRQLADAYGRARNEVLPDIDPDAGPDAGLGERNNKVFKQSDGAGRQRRGPL
jgi:hypothetical protein